MSKISDAFQNGKAFIGFVTGGDPDIDTTARLIEAMAESGADMVEIGIPFSDPIAEGPVIQAASERALRGGVTVDALFSMVERVREKVSIPLLFMTYANPIFAYGTDRFMERCRQAGIDGVIVPDVPFEEKDLFAPACRRHGIDWISMVSPTSGQRAAAIAREAEGFLYCVSSLGVTGIRSEIDAAIRDVINQAKAVSSVPCAIGFGISTPEQARRIGGMGDGVIVGSAIVRLAAEYGTESVPYVRDYVTAMKQALAAAE